MSLVVGEGLAGMLDQVMVEGLHEIVSGHGFTVSCIVTALPHSAQRVLVDVMSPFFLSWQSLTEMQFSVG